VANSVSPSAPRTRARLSSIAWATLVTVVLGERLPKQATVSQQQLGVGVTGCLQELRRAFDIGEQHGDRALGSSRHPQGAPDQLDSTCQSDGIDVELQCGIAGP
jgi:hypothetical protein